MKVTVTVGQTTRELEVRGDLLAGYTNDARQDMTMSKVGAAFVEAYAEEVRRVKETRDQE